VPRKLFGSIGAKIQVYYFFWDFFKGFKENKSSYPIKFNGKSILGWGING
jgi:hypothetical protein